MTHTSTPLLRQQAFIDGRWCDADTGQSVVIYNPATQAAIGQVPIMGASETRSAIDAAQRALPAWRSLSAGARAELLYAWYERVMAHQEALAELMTLEQGKPLTESRGEIAYGASFIRWYAEEARRAYGETIPGHQADKRIVVIKQAVGVAAAITPWNFPNAMITRKAAPALAAGCTLVLKPAPQTPFSALALAQLASEAGIPDGVINVVTSDTEGAIAVGEELCQNPIVRKLSFTGSTATGVKLMQACAPTLKKLSLELGGNAPFIVFDDADVDAAVAGAMLSKYRNAGQTCVCANRIYVQSGIYHEFVQKFTQAVAQLKVGNGLDADTTIGPLINLQAVEKVEAHLADALEQGGTLLCGGKRHALGGHFFEPTVIGDAHAGMRLAQEETFGPLAPLFRFEHEADVIAQANATEFGLAAYFYARDLSRVWRVAEALEYGMVGINTGLISTEVAPFGGIKSSGLGREGAHQGLDEYLELKYLCMQV